MFKIKQALIILGSILLFGCESTVDESASQNDDRPNILFILLDDLGKEWISSYGADNIRTPNIDKLAEQGMKFTNV
jgi:hypothetical protein